MRSFCLFIVGYAGLFPSAAGLAQSPDERRLQEILEPIRKKHRVPALAAAVVNSKGLVAAAAVGVRKQGDAAAVTVEDRFHLGSDTKAMTATLIARLVEAGKLRYDDSLEKAFPDLAESMNPAQRTITLVHLLTHRSGLPGNFESGLGWWQFALIDGPRQQRQAAVKKAVTMDLKSKPGEKFLYSNLGYVVAGAMAEKAADAPWDELLKREVFKPLGMTTAGFGPPASADKIDQPWPHHGDGKPQKPGLLADNPAVMGPAGTVHCSMPDWGKFVADHLKGARRQAGLLKSETYKRLHSSPFGKPFYTPGGWGGTEGPDGLVLAHDGSNAMNYASALLLPAKDIAVLTASNRGGDAGQNACQEAREAILKAWKIKANNGR